MALLLYADFTDSHCHLASRRVDLLRAADVAVDWRAVETLPHLPVTGGRDPHRHANLARQREEVTGLLAEGEQFSGGLPGFVANTRAAVSAYAEAYGAGVGDDVRRLLFALYWEDGVDIGNPSSLRSPLAAPILRGSSAADPLCRFGYAVSVMRGPITTAAWRRIRAWRDEWQALGARQLPVLVDGIGTKLSGTEALRYLGEHKGRDDAKLNRVLPDPGHRLEQTVRPPMAWASQVGGLWNRAGWTAQSL